MPNENALSLLTPPSSKIRALHLATCEQGTERTIYLVPPNMFCLFTSYGGSDDDYNSRLLTDFSSRSKILYDNQRISDSLNLIPPNLE